MLLEALVITASLLLLALGLGMLWAVRELRRLRRDVLARAQGSSVPELLIHGALSRIEQRLATLEAALTIPAVGLSGPSEPVASTPLSDPTPPPPPVVEDSVAAMAWDPWTSSLPRQSGAALPEPVKSAVEPAADAPDAYTLARQLAQQGADVQALVQSCALSSDEAELVLRMHGAMG